MPTNKQRREAARRHLERQAQRREQRDAARKRFTLIASIVGSVLLIAVVVGFIVFVGHDDKKKQTAASDNPTVASPSASATSSTSTSPALPLGTCKFVAGGTASKKVTLPADKAPTKGTLVSTVKTTQGTITFTLDRAKAPCAAENFASLAKQHYFDKTPCHRLVTSGIFVLQCGDPAGTGSGGPGYSFNDELTGSEKYTTGVLAMANSGPNTNGSQFFIVYKDSTLGPQYTIFGRVSAGLPVVAKVAAKGASSGTDGKPKLPISITSATVAG